MKEVAALKLLPLPLLLFVSLIGTPTAGLTQSATQWVSVEGAAGAKLQAAVFRPSGDGPFPIVILLHSASGQSQEVVGWGPDLARARFVVVAGCFFARPPAVSPLVTPLPVCPEAPQRDETFAVRNLVAMIEFAKRLPGVRSDRTGLVGWSWGGALALVAATSVTDARAVVSVAGGPLGLQPTRNDPSAASVVDRLGVPVLLLHGTRDNVVSVDSIRQFEAQALTLGKNIESHYVEGADHFLLVRPAIQGRVD